MSLLTEAAEEYDIYAPSFKDVSFFELKRKEAHAQVGDVLRSERRSESTRAYVLLALILLLQLLCVHRLYPLIHHRVSSLRIRHHHHDAACLLEPNKKHFDSIRCDYLIVSPG